MIVRRDPSDIPRTVVVRLLGALLVPLLVLLESLGTLIGFSSGASAVSGQGYDAPAHVYDGAVHSVQLHASEAAPVVSQEGLDGLQGTVAEAFGPLAVFSRLSVAANSADERTTVGRWVGDEELLLMQKYGRVVEGRSDGRTFVVNSANPDAYPAGTGNFVQFRVPASSLKPAGKPE